jgi:uncharacterized protein
MEPKQYLYEYIKKLGKVVIAFSGGVDSSVISKIAFDSLKDNAIAITIVSESFSRKSFINAVKISYEIGIKHIIFKTDKTNNEQYSKNTLLRCYYCKKIDSKILKNYAANNNIPYICDGVNVDDLGDYRPGLKAMGEENILHPFVIYGLTKNDVRNIAKDLRLSNSNMPADSCLASRLLYGEQVTSKKLSQIAEAENFLLSLGFSNVRVRLKDGVARIELPKNEMSRLLEDNKYELVSNYLKSIGFSYVTLDLEGLRKGAVNANL